MLRTLTYCITVGSLAALKYWLFSKVFNWLPKLRADLSQWLTGMQQVLCLLALKCKRSTHPSHCAETFALYRVSSLTYCQCLFPLAGAEKCTALLPSHPSCNSCTWICPRAAAVRAHLHVPLLPHVTHEVRQPNDESPTDMAFFMPVSILIFVNKLIYVLAVIPVMPIQFI